MATAREALQIVFDSGAEFAAEIDRFVDTTVTEQQWQAFLADYAPIPEAEGRSRTMAINKRDTLLKLWYYDGRVAPLRGTAYGVLQATNTYNQHEATVRGVSRPERTKVRAIDGTTARNDAVALGALERLMDHA